MAESHAHTYTDRMWTDDGHKLNEIQAEQSQNIDEPGPPHLVWRRCCFLDSIYSRPFCANTQNENKKKTGFTITTTAAAATTTIGPVGGFSVEFTVRAFVHSVLLL